MNHPTIQLLEPRRLLAVHFAAADLAGTFGLFAESASGILTLNAAGTVTGGSFTDGDGVTSQITGGTFTITPAGLVHATVETSDPEIDGIGLVGAMTSNKDGIVLSSRDQLAADEVLVALIRRGSSLRTADLAGSWTFADDSVSGSLTIDSRGRLSGSLSDRDLSVTVNVSGSVALDADGTGSGTVTFTVPGEGSISAAARGAISRAKDLLSLTVDVPDLGEGGLSAVLVRGGSGNLTNADVVGSWTLASAAGHGTINFDGNGRITGGVATPDAGSTGTLSGTYSVSADGAFTGKFRFTDANTTTNATLVGRLNASKNLVILDGAPLPGAFGNFSETAMLVRPDGVFATLASGRLSVLGTDAPDITGLSVRSGSLNVTQNSVTQKFSAAGVTSIVVAMGGGNDGITLGGGVIGASLAGGAGKDTLVGGDGNDILSGEASNDLLIGGNGFDTLYGGDGNDRLEGHGQGDSLRGGRGNDVLLGGTSNDKLFGDTGDDSLDGGRQNDRLDGGVGNDTVFGGADNDVIFARDAFIDLIDGSTGNDSGQLDPDDEATGIETLLA